MPRKVFVATTSFGLPTPAPATVERNVEQAGALIDAAGAHQPDLVCLPEAFHHAGLPLERAMELAQTIPGPVFDTLAARSRQYRTYIAAGLFERRGDRLFNTVCVVDRQGQLVGRYDKVHPTITEMDAGVIPGREARVVETDFGRVGLAVCFDINWLDLWDEMARLGAEIVVWPSAYDGGFPLQMHAWTHQYHVVSSVWSRHGRIVDVAGQILATTSRFGGLAVHEIDLEKTVFHADYNMARLLELERSLGRRIAVEMLCEEGVFTLQSNDPELPLAEVVRRFGLETYRDYIKRASVMSRRSHDQRRFHWSREAG